MNKRLLALMKEERYARDFQLLRTVPGVGSITSISILLECGDLSGFSSVKAFCALVGIVPDCDISDTHKAKTSITRRRHRVLRYMLTECAWRAVSSDKLLSKLYGTYT